MNNLSLKGTLLLSVDMMEINAKNNIWVFFQVYFLLDLWSRQWLLLRGAVARESDQTAASFTGEPKKGS